MADETLSVISPPVDESPAPSGVDASSDAGKVEATFKKWAREVSFAFKNLTVSVPAASSVSSPTTVSSPVIISSGVSAGGNGWSPIIALVPGPSGVGIVALIIDWTGGSTTKPAAGLYIAESGLTSNINLAVNIQGPQGTTGLAGGFTLHQVFSAGTTAPPGAGMVAYNNATFGSITHVFASTLDRSGNDISGIMGQLVAGNYILIFEENNGTKFSIFAITTVTPHTGYIDFTVTPISGVVLDGAQNAGFCFCGLGTGGGGGGVTQIIAGTGISISPAGGTGNVTISVSGAGTGDVIGPAGAVADNFASYNGVTGKLIKDSGKSAASFDVSGAAAAAQAAAIAAAEAYADTYKLSKAQNLLDVANAPTAFDNIKQPVSTGRSGVAPVLPNDASKYLDGTGNWSTPAGGGGGLPSGGAKYARLAKNSATNYDAGWYGPYDFNVKDYGAVGNGLTNDRAAIAAADTAAAAVGGTVVFPYGTFYVATALTIASPVVIQGMIQPESGQTITFSGTIKAPKKQIFSGSYILNTIQIGAATSLIPVEWFGAGLGGDDSLSIQAAINSTGTSANPTQIIAMDGAYTTRSSRVITVLYGTPISASPNSTLTAGTGATDAFLFSGNGIAKSTLPRIHGFSSGAGITIRNCGVWNFDLQEITTSHIAVKYLMDASGGKEVLDTKVFVQHISNCAIGALVTSDGSSGCVFQGNELHCNFFDTGYNAVSFDNVANVSWDGNIWDFIAIDVNNIVGAKAFFNQSPYFVARNVFKVTGWFGGCVDSSCYVYGYFVGCTFEFAIADIPGAYTRFTFASGSGFNQIISLGTVGSFGLPAGLAMPTTPGSPSGEWANAGYNNTLGVYISLSGMAAGATQVCYAYSALLDGKSNLFRVNTTSAIGVICESIVDDTATDAYQMKLTLRNVSGGTVTGFYQAIITVAT